MRFLDVLERFIYQSKPVRFLALALAVSLVKTGVWHMPNLAASYLVCLDPFRNPFGPDAHYLFWNWLSPFLAWRLGIHNENFFLLFHFLFSVAFTFTFIALVWSRFEAPAVRAALVLFLAIPASGTAYYWIGIDSVTLTLMLLLFVVAGHLWLVLVIGVLLGMQHFEQGVVAMGALTLALALSSVLKTGAPYPLRWAITSLLGIVLGKLVLVFLFRHYGIQVNSGRIYLLQRMYPKLLGFFFHRFQYVLWSVLGVGWIAVAKFAERIKVAVPFLIALAGLLLLLLIVGDQTRVLAIVSFPLVAAYLLLNPAFLRSLDQRFVAWIFGLWLIVPWPWVLGNGPHVSVFPYDVAYVLHRLFGWFDAPTNRAIWGF
jgi:hypothetical protein